MGGKDDVRGSYSNITTLSSVIFKLDALAKAWSVIATATWLAGWLGGWLAGCHTPVLYQNR